MPSLPWTCRVCITTPTKMHVEECTMQLGPWHTKFLVMCSTPSMTILLCAFWHRGQSLQWLLTSSSNVDKTKNCVILYLMFSLGPGVQPKESRLMGHNKDLAHTSWPLPLKRVAYVALFTATTTLSLWINFSALLERDTPLPIVQAFQVHGTHHVANDDVLPSAALCLGSFCTRVLIKYLHLGNFIPATTWKIWLPLLPLVILFYFFCVYHGLPHGPLLSWIQFTRLKTGPFVEYLIGLY